MLNAALMSDVAAAVDTSFDEVVRQCDGLVLRTAYRILGNWADAEDVAQDAFVRLHKRGVDFANESGLKAWLYRVTVNLCLDHRRATRPTEELLEIRSHGLSAEAEAIRTSEKQRLMAALAQLPTKERAAVVLREIEGLSTIEVAEALGSTEGTVRSQVSKAMVRLREILGREEA